MLSIISCLAPLCCSLQQPATINRPRPTHPPTPQQVPAGGRADYPLTYRPLTMSAPEAPHEGSVFFPIPDGSGLLYRLVGQVRAAARTLLRCLVADV